MKHLLICWIVFIALPVLASDRTITGTLLDADTKESLPYATISVMDHSRGTFSDKDGRFVLGLEGILPNDTIAFSYLGYKTKKVLVGEIKDSAIIYLEPAVLELEEVNVSTSPLTAVEIVELVKKNYDKNYVPSPSRKKMYYHKYSKTPFNKENQLTLKKSDFEGLDNAAFDKLMNLIPDDLIEYHDAIVELYSEGNRYKLIPLKGVSMEEGSQQELMKEVETQMGSFFNDLEKTKGNKDIYYKFRTGIFGFKFGNSDGDLSLIEENKKDTSNYTIVTDYLKYNILTLMKEYCTIHGKNWEFVNNPHLYNYTKKDTTLFNESVFEISFSAKINKTGLFDGVMYVSKNSFAILQLEFAFAKNKQSDKFKLLGFGYAMNFKRARVIFEKGENGYFARYLNVQHKEFFSVDRNFSIMRKKKRLLIDKELNEIKLKVDMYFNSDSYWEILVLDRNGIDASQFDKVKQPTTMKFKKQTTDQRNSSILEPTTQLKKYKKK